MDSTRTAAAVVNERGEASSRKPSTPPPPKRELYACAYEKEDIRTGEWKPGILHVHAVDPAAAKFELLKSVDWKRERIHVVGIARVIGYFVNDKKGLVLSAS